LGRLVAEQDPSGKLAAGIETKKDQPLSPEALVFLQIK